LDGAIDEMPPLPDEEPAAAAAVGDDGKEKLPEVALTALGDNRGPPTGGPMDVVVVYEGRRVEGEDA